MCGGKRIGVWPYCNTTFAEGWYLKLVDKSIPKEQKSLEKLCEDFKEAFVSKDLQDWAFQTIYSLTMDQFHGNFNQFSTALRLAQYTVVSKPITSW